MTPKKKKTLIIIAVVVSICTLVSCISSVAGYFIFIKDDTDTATEDQTESSTDQDSKYSDDDKTDADQNGDGNTDNDENNNDADGSDTQDPANMSEEEIFETAMSQFQQEPYKLENTIKADMEMDYDMEGMDSLTMSMEMTIEAQRDPDSSNFHLVTTVSMQGIEQETEMYYVDGKLYSKMPGESFEELKGSQKDHFIDSYEQQLNPIKQMQENVSIKKRSEGGKVNGKDTYKYTLEYDTQNMEDLVNQLFGDMSDTEEVEISNLQIDDYTTNVYISKTDLTVEKTEESLENLSMSIKSAGMTIDVKMKNMELTSVYKDWGKDLNIKAPI